MSDPYRNELEAICNACGQRYADAGDLGRPIEDNGELWCAECQSEDITLFEVP